jgi:hypothetical protein
MSKGAAFSMYMWASVHLALLQKKLGDGEEEKIWQCTTCFILSVGKWIEQEKLKILCGPEAPISGFVKDQSC